jgi:hypothetical protein
MKKDVLIPQDGTPFDAQTDQIVRAVGRSVSGGSIKALVTGPAQIISENVQVPVSNGKIMMGELVKEFDLEPTGTGSVQVDLIEETPVGGVSPMVTQYRFNVQ